MTKPVITFWFVEPSNAHTNEIIAKNLAALNQLDEHLALSDVNGIDHSVFQVENHAFITRLYKDTFKFSLKFNVFFRQGKHGLLQQWKFKGNTIKKRVKVKKK